MKRVYTLFALVSLCAIFLTLTNYYKKANDTVQQRASKESEYILILENDEVNLYYGNIYIKTYDNIVTDVLPPTDRDNLKSGIILKDYEAVLSIIEDFDG